MSDQQQATVPGLIEPDRVIHKNDVVKITLRMPGRSVGSLEAVQKDGDVATPDGSFVKADGLSLLAFRTNLAAVYAGIIGYENVRIEAYIYSSPYRVMGYHFPQTAPVPADHALAQSVATNLPPPTIYPRIFKSPLTIWQAIQLEGGIPKGVNSTRVRILKRDLQRKTLDCSGKDGMPDGNRPVESGDNIFLVPDGVPILDIFD